MGYPGEYNRIEVRKTLSKLTKKLLNGNVSSGFHVIESDSKHTIQKIKEGYNLLAFSLDFFPWRFCQK